MNFLEFFVWRRETLSFFSFFKVVFESWELREEEDGDENGEEKIISAQDSSFHVFGDAREISSIKLKNGKILILVAQNQNKLLAFEQS